MRTHASVTHAQPQSSSHVAPATVSPTNSAVENQPDIASQLSAAAHFGHRLSDISRLPPGRPMVVRPSDDHYEQEADRVADLIVAEVQSPGADGTEPVTVTPLTSNSTGDPVQRQSFRSNTGGSVAPSLAADIYHAQSHGGQPLPPHVRLAGERVLRADLSRVRLHQGSAVQRLTSVIGSDAFVSGNSIFLGAPTQEMSLPSMSRLLAHELIHIIQQRPNVAASVVQRWNPFGRCLGRDEPDPSSDELEEQRELLPIPPDPIPFTLPTIAYQPENEGLPHEGYLTPRSSSDDEQDNKDLPVSPPKRKKRRTKHRKQQNLRKTSGELEQKTGFLGIGDRFAAPRRGNEKQRHHEKIHKDIKNQDDDAFVNSICDEYFPHMGVDTIKATGLKKAKAKAGGNSNAITLSVSKKHIDVAKSDYKQFANLVNIIGHESVHVDQIRHKKNSGHQMYKHEFAAYSAQAIEGTDQKRDLPGLTQIQKLRKINSAMRNYDEMVKTSYYKNIDNSEKTMLEERYMKIMSMKKELENTTASATSRGRKSKKRKRTTGSLNANYFHEEDC